jgi:hypothetical protein
MQQNMWGLNQQQIKQLRAILLEFTKAVQATQVRIEGHNPQTTTELEKWKKV